MELMKLSPISLPQLSSRPNPLLLPKCRGPASPHGVSRARCSAPSLPSLRPSPPPSRCPAPTPSPLLLGGWMLGEPGSGVHMWILLKSAWAWRLRGRRRPARGGVQSWSAKPPGVGRLVSAGAGVPQALAEPCRLPRKHSCRAAGAAWHCWAVLSALLADELTTGAHTAARLLVRLILRLKAFCWAASAGGWRG